SAIRLHRRPQDRRRSLTPSLALSSAQPAEMRPAAGPLAPRPEGEDEAGGREHEPDRPQQDPEDRRPKRLPDGAAERRLQKMEAAGRDSVPDLAGGGRGPLAALMPSKQIPAEEDERRGDQQPADDPQDGQSGPSFPLFGGP